MDEMQELIANEVEVQKKDIKDKKHQITALIAMLEKQRAIIQRVAEKIELSTEVCNKKFDYSFKVHITVDLLLLLLLNSF